MKTKIVEIDKLGPAEIISPLEKREWINFVTDENSVISTLHQDELMPEINNGVLEFFELAGPRRKIYFDLKDLKCGIVTCGGLCPGINDIIRELVFELWQEYGVEDIEGFRYGYMGIAEADKITPIKLTPELTDSIHRDGGTILGSSRGPQDTGVMVDSLVKRGIKILFTVGGDGTMKGAHELAKEIKRRGLDISVIGIPKTIDNDIDYVENSFGFETSVQAAADIIDSAHNESKGAPDCIGLVKLMGRASGFIAAHTALANRDVNYCLIPELGFRLEGPGGFLEVLKERLRIKRHAVIVVAEGAGQELMNHGDGEVKRDKSGNIRLKDIGLFLKKEIESYFIGQGLNINIKYFEPSYMIRGIPANAADSLYCVHLAQNAVHAAISGRTDMLISRWNAHYVHVPISMTVKGSKKVSPAGRLWRTVMEATGQPYSFFVPKSKV